MTATIQLINYGKRAGPYGGSPGPDGVIASPGYKRGPVPVIVIERVTRPTPN